MGENRVWELKKYDVPGRKVVMTEGIGLVNVEGVREITSYVVVKGKSFGGKWGYIPIIEKMDPILDPETQQEFAKMHKSCEEAGCVAFAFVAGGMAAIKVQAKRHQQASHTGLVTEYFRTKEEALDWLKEEFGL
ncbi:MAG: hypothetical protein GXZ01_06540 [Clostridiaceae bacterium]|nr:hypothetical protein [Clostridiaceae bacterium]